ncbi:glycyl-radical enzyme activating protein [candidate division KSB1 bacterium]|nr:glycyl-radical enzyme activating protein [candidate division KSB1 bacterium]MBL7093296.1 glycyl-radical enzyme activating protein [candidate division KSB1 bacterium]
MPNTGIIFDLKKYAVHDGPGIRTTVFFKGCPLNCWWCHNPESQKPEPEPRQKFNQKSNLKLLQQKENLIGKKVTAREVMEEVEKDIVFYDESCGGVTFSGGEPLLQENFLLALLKECRDKEIHTTIDTCGFAPYSVFEKIDPFVDLYLYDIKICDDELHKKYTGVSNNLIHGNLVRLSKLNKNINIRIPLIPGVVDTEDNITNLIRFISTLKNIKQIDLLPYNKIGEGKYEKINRKNLLGAIDFQSNLEIERIANKFKTLGIKVTRI